MSQPRRRPRLPAYSASVLALDTGKLKWYYQFNQVEFIALNADYLFAATRNAAANAGKYTTTTNPRNVGLTLRLDF